MYYVMQDGEPWALNNTIAYSFQPQAIHRAEMLFKQTGKTHIVVKVEPIWRTTTLADLMEEDNGRS